MYFMNIYFFVYSFFYSLCLLDLPSMQIHFFTLQFFLTCHIPTFITLQKPSITIHVTLLLSTHVCHSDRPLLDCTVVEQVSATVASLEQKLCSF